MQAAFRSGAALRLSFTCPQRSVRLLLLGVTHTSASRPRIYTSLEDRRRTMSTMAPLESTPDRPTDSLKHLEDHASAWLTAEAQRLEVALDDTAIERLARYSKRIAAGATRAGLTSVRDPLGIVRRHFGEALALLAVLREAGLLTRGTPARVVDIGSGAGIPGLVMRIAEPALRITLVESNARRCTFLRETATELCIGDVQVLNARAEEAGHDPELRERFDLSVARAVAPLPVLVEYALPLLAPGGLLAAPKGSRWAAELDAAGPAIAELGGEALAPLTLPAPTGRPQQRVLLVHRINELPAHLPRRPGVPSRRPLGSLSQKPPTEGSDNSHSAR